MTDHYLVVEDGYVDFECKAQIKDGVIPGCWYSIDDDGNRKTMGECNATRWINEWPLVTRGSFRIPVDVEWQNNDDGPIVVFKEEKQRADFAWALTEIQRLHVPVIDKVYGVDMSFCPGCREFWPCKTIQIIENLEGK